MSQLGRSYVKPHIGKFIGPFPLPPGPVARNWVVIARQPTVLRAKPHITRILGPIPPPVSTSLLFRAKQPTVLRPKPHIQRFTGYPAPPGPVSKNLLVITRYKRPPTHTLANSVSVLRLPIPATNSQNWIHWIGGAWMG